MPEYLYTARDAHGGIKQGTLIATSEHGLAEILREQGLMLTHTETKAGKKKALGGKHLGSIFGHVSLMEKVLFTEHLEIMIKAGIPIGKALGILAKQTANVSFREVITDIEESVQKGQPLATSLAKYPKVFPEIYVNMVKVGEVSGKLEETLTQLALQMKKDYELLSKVRGAMLYPIVVLTLMLAVIILVVVYVLPRLTSVFKEMDVKLPTTTKVLIAFSEFMERYGIFVGIGMIGLVIAGVFLAKSKFGKPKLHKLYLRLPILSGIVQKINLARFARTSSSLIKSGVPIIHVLEIVAGVLGNMTYKAYIFAATQDIKKGRSVSETLAENPKLFSPVVTQMIAIGEETGNLEKILDDLADYYESDVTNTMNNLSSIIEPILLVILGIGAGMIAISVIAPIYSLVNQI